MSRSRLSAVPDPENEPTAAEVFDAMIDQSWREYHSDQGDVTNPEGWQPYRDPDVRRDVLNVDGVLKDKRILPENQKGWLRKWLRL